MDRRNTTEQVVRKLSVFLRQHGDQVLSGQSKLSLTANSLRILNEGFGVLSTEDFTTSFEALPANSTRIPAYQDLQFLYDLVQKTVALKVIHGTGTLQGRVNVAVFRSLRLLEVKKTPLHLIEGIQKVRDKLSALVCTRCVSNLQSRDTMGSVLLFQELFESCGGDLTSAMSWPELLNLDLSYNTIDELDSSLRLLPRLEQINLSHNTIADTVNYLEYLTELVAVNLGYNLLRQLPSLAVSVKSRLQLLVLRNNDLDHIQGLEELTSLKELDLANNCLIEHDCLLPLRMLQKLHNLMLEGNPLSYHKQHRRLTMERIHPMAARMLILDRKPVTDPELRHCRQSMLTPSLPSTSSTQQLIINDPPSAFEQSLDYTSATTTHDDTDFRFTPVSISSGGRSKGKRSKAKVKARPAEISDLDVDVSSEYEASASFKVPTSSSTPVKEQQHMDMKEELETLRQQLGPDWLQSVATQKRLTNQSATNLKPTNGKKDSPKHSSTGSPRRMELTNGTETLSGSPQSDKIPPEAEPVVEMYAANELKQKPSPESSHVTLNGDCHTPVDEYNGGQECDGDRTEGESGDQKRRARESTSSEIAIYSTPNKSSIHNDPEDMEDDVDYGIESEPFIVTLTSTSEQLLVSVTEHYLLEKNLDGHLVAKLELKCLRSAQVAPTGEPELRLLFDYRKKDKKQRNYGMEDEDNAQAFHDLLKPALEERRTLDQLKDRYQCFKCRHEFRKSEAGRDLTSSSVDSRKLLGETLLCPSCGSEMVVAMETSPRTKSGAPTNRVGSFSALGSDLSPVKRLPPVASTPTMKRNGSTGTMNSDSTSYRSAHTDLSTSFQSCTTPGRPAATDTSSSSSYSEGYLTKSALKNLKTTETTPSRAEIFSSESSSTVQMATSVGFDISNLANDRLLANENQSAQTQKVPSDKQSQMSTDSDIVVLPNPSRTCSASDSDIIVLGTQISAESDILVIPEPGNDAQNRRSNISSGLAMKTVQESSHRVGLPSPSINIEPVKPSSDLDVHSPVRSLTEDTVNSMVSSMYENHQSSSTQGSLVEGSPFRPSILFTLGSAQNSPVPFKSSVDFMLGSEENSPAPSPFQSAVGFTIGTPGSNGSSSRQSTTGSSPGGAVVKQQRVPEEEPPPVVEDSGIKYSYEDFSVIDHRLKLHFMMNVFGDSEEFSLVLKASGIVHYPKTEEFKGLVVLSDTKLYVLKMKTEDSTEDPGKWLKLKSHHSLTEMKHVDIGLGYQSLRLEFIDDRGCYVVLIRDQKRGRKFVRQFTSQIQKVSLSAHSHLEGISKNPDVLHNLEQQVLLSATRGQHQQQLEEADTDDGDRALVKFVMCYLKTGEVDQAGVPSLSPVSIAVIKSHICMATENHCLPPPRVVAPGNVKHGNQQFKLKDLQKITDITSVDLSTSFPSHLTLNFCEEETQEECSWLVVMETKDGRQSLVETVGKLWEAEFNVDMQINWS